ncbi:translation initiation factor eIF-2B [Natronobacterium gregoryi]|uniref:Initiation factor 2B-like protein n=2 Tax=Natronobacterium gregoryi TaxID=44930 RepID=L0AMQ9_NATGS|nr:translation initiation factor eIF-2B [Natronobacterium gregoryi]AFZ74744.1 translation initiation factor 2B subunit, eIF-2B alpha/beta/delta family [Natronobacterium gregoryi SP2]ELY73448.1 initiation factor 2B-like protein [Natronobacterium gregoryi SP2]PLK20986.1 translation initiation factor eIF-2B [Natronobacterium gregoryi SP2]SFJ03494.1 translation initiation factor eIF-2B subunit delta [Natronobacterium gregoryi]
MIDETVEEIQEMQTHSSSVVAVKATQALAELTEREFATVEEYVRALERNGSVLRQANPSHASLQNAVRTVVEDVSDADLDDVEAVKELTREQIDEVVSRVESGKRLAAENAAELLADGATILTHDYSSTVIEALEIAVEDGKTFDVYVTEARPRYIGRKTVRVLADLEGVEPTLITDGAHGHYLEECDRVVVGMDCIVDGTLYNRVGTFPIAATANRLDVPVTVLGSAAKLVSEGFVFENEFRSGSEVMPEPAEGFDVENPAYDATPVTLLESVVTDDGRQEL